MKLACLSFTLKGRILGERLKSLNLENYQVDHIINSKISGGIREFLKNNWKAYEGFIFISATGIAVRMIHPYIVSKDKDPAIVVVDDEGKFSISLLSGHLGGANNLAETISLFLGTQPVITTASDNRGIGSIDLFAKENNYHIEDLSSVTNIAALMVNNKVIGIYTEEEELINYPNLMVVENLEKIDPEIQGLIIVSSKENIKVKEVPYTILRPKNINIGLGCRKGVDKESVIEAIELALKEVGLSNKSIKEFGTVEIKKEEEGLIEAVKHFSCPLRIFSVSDLLPLEDMFKKSDFVKNTIGVSSVSEPCAYLLGGQPIIGKFIHKGVTISINK